MASSSLSAYILSFLNAKGQHCSNASHNRIFIILETCDNVDCGPGKRCKMNRRSKPRCVCAPDCSNITWKGPVCGSDGKTYKDECALLKAKCKGHPDLDVQYQGKCKSTKYCLYIYINIVTCQITHRCMCQISIPIVPVSVFPQTLQMSLSFQKRAATSCAPAAPHASWTKQITHTVWRVIGFAQRWRHLSSTCVETTGSSTPVHATWEELPVSSADPSEWRMRENASVSLHLEMTVKLCSSITEYSVSAFYSWWAAVQFSQHSSSILSVSVFGNCLCLLKNW